MNLPTNRFSQNNTCLTISVPLCERYIRVVTEFVHNAALSFGVDASDVSTLELIAEECFVYSKSGFDNFIGEPLFTMSFHLYSEGVMMECRYTGMPFHLRRSFAFLHSQVTEDAETDDISIFLLKSITDDIQFIDQKRDGWTIKITKRCETHLPSPQSSEWNPVVLDDLKIRKAIPADAQNIAELTFHTYGVTYSNPTFYEPDSITSMIANNEADIYLAFWKGKAIGMEGLIRISDSLYEDGLIMLSPAYRHSHANIRLHSYMLSEFTKHHSDTVIYVDCVTSHVRSQAMFRNEVGSCISFSAYDVPQYVGINKDANKRESLIFIIVALAKPYHWHLYAPSEHETLLTSIVTNIGGTLDVSPYSGEVNADNKTVILSRLEFEGDSTTLYFLLETCGDDFMLQLRRLTRDMVRKGALAINLAINLSKPMPGNTTISLHKAGYFFTGFIPSADHGWEMVYEYMAPQAFDFSNVQILMPQNRNLMDYILRDKEIADNTMI